MFQGFSLDLRIFSSFSFRPIQKAEYHPVIFFGMKVGLEGLDCF